MRLEWAPDGASFIATRGRRTVRVAPLSGLTSGAPSSRWLAFGPTSQMLTPGPSGSASWATIEEAKAACEQAIAPRKRGRTARTTRPVKATLTPEGIDRLDAYRDTLPLHEGRVCPRTRALEALVMALPAKEIP